MQPHAEGRIPQCNASLRNGFRALWCVHHRPLTVGSHTLKASSCLVPKIGRMKEAAIVAIVAFLLGNGLLIYSMLAMFSRRKELLCRARSPGLALVESIGMHVLLS